MDPTPALLRSLVGVCTDGHHGYETAAAHAGGMELRRFLSKLAAQREEFGAQLCEQLGSDPHSRGSAAGALHRGWIDLKDRVGLLSQADLLNECLRGEAAAIKRYEDVLAQPMRAEVMTLVAGQLARIIEAHDRLRRLAEEGGG